MVFPHRRLVRQFGDVRARIEERHEEHVITGGLQRSENVLLPGDPSFAPESRDHRPPVDPQLVGMMAAGLDHVEDVGLKLARRVPFQSGEVDGGEELEPRSQLQSGLIDGLRASGVVRLVMPIAAIESKPVDPRRLRFLDFPLVVVHSLALRGEADHVVREDVVPFRSVGLGGDRHRCKTGRQQEQYDHRLPSLEAEVRHEGVSLVSRVRHTRQRMDGLPPVISRNPWVGKGRSRGSRGFHGCWELVGWS